MAGKDTVTRILITAKDEASAVFGGLKTKAAAVATAIAGYFGIKLFGRAVEEAEALDVQMRKLEGVINATGGAAGLTAQEIDQMARRLDEATTGSAAGFRDAAAQLLTFKNVGKDAFETTLMLAQDLADAGFGSVTTNAVQLGKALEDPERGMSALTRSGVSFSQQQQTVIKRLVETGRAAEAQQMILEAVAGQVGGTAAAIGGGLTGVRDLIGKLTTDLREQFGGTILPVLQRTQERVAGFLRQLRDSEAAVRFGEVVASAMELGERAFERFIAKFDIDAVIAKLKAWASTTRETVGQWSEYLSNASTVATAAFGAIATGFNVVKTGSLTLAASIAQSMSALTGMYARLLEMISGVIPQMRQSAEEWRSVSDAFGEAARQNFDRATEAADRTQESFFRTTEALGDLLGLEQQAAAQTANTAAAIERTGQAAALTADQLDAMGEGYEYVDGSARQAAEGIDATTSAAADAARTLNGAAEAVVDVDEAFRELGVTSVAELQRVADRARVAFDTIRASGNASVEDVQRAFRVYADRAIAANGGVVDSTLQSTAKMLGLKVEADQTGRVIVEAMNKAAAATGGLAEQTGRAATGFRDLARAAREAGEATQGGGSGNGRAAGMPALNQLTGNYDRAERLGGSELRQQLENIYRANTEFRRLPMSWTSYMNTMSKVFQEQEKAIEAFEERQQRIDARAAAGRDTRPTSAPAQQPFTPAAGPQLGTVTVNLGGRPRRIETTAAGARELEALLRELESSMERAT